MSPGGTGSGGRDAAKRGPDAAPSRGGLVLGHPGGGACPTSLLLALLPVPS